MATKTSNLQVLNQFASNYFVEAFTTSPSMLNSPMVSENSALVSATDEGFVASIRYLKELNPTVNVPDQSSTDATTTDVTAAKATGIKTIRAVAFPVTDVAEREGQANVLASVASNAGNVAANSLDKSLGNILKGVAAYEIGRGVGQTTPDAVATTGFWASAGNTTVAAYLGSSGYLIDPSKTGAAKVESLLRALALAFKDTLGNERVFLVTPASVEAELKAANVTGQTEIEGANARFTTVLNGQVVIMPTRNATNDFSVTASGGDTTKVVTGHNKTSYFVRENSLIWAPSTIQNQIEFERNALRGLGGGETTMVARFGGVIHPGQGYTWAGDTAGYAGEAGNGTSFLYNNANSLSSNWAGAGGSELNKGIFAITHK